MMTELDKTASLVKGMVDAVKIPVTAKMRLGWDDQNIHRARPGPHTRGRGCGGRFSCMAARANKGFGGTVNLAGIRAVVDAVQRIPVIGNGDVTTPDAARRMIDETGCAGVSIGRGAFYNPWIFLHTRQYLRTGALLPEPGFEERMRVLCRHLDLMVEVFGEEHGCRMFRKVAPWYAKRFGPANLFNKRVVTLSSKAEFHKILGDYLDWRATVPRRERRVEAPVPTRADGGVPSCPSRRLASATHIPVPKGPVEVW